MCADRLSAGEAPACVQACPSEAIRIVVVDKAEVTASARRGEFLPLAPRPAYTQPTTRYKSKKRVPNHLIAGDHGRLKPSESHLPLVFMLVLSQLGVGASVAATLGEPSRLLTVIGAFAAALAPCIALLHLGKPLKAWRAFLGWRTSWFSREVIAFCVFGAFAAGAMVSTTITGSTALAPLLKITAAASGLFAVACSAMIYVDTRREFWRASQSFGRFFETTLLLGAATTFVLQMSAGVQARLTVSPALVVAATVTKLILELRVLRHLERENTFNVTSLGKSARLLVGDLGFALLMRVGCAVLGGLIFPALSVAALAYGSARATLPAMVLGTFVFCLAGELLERYLFFTAVAPEKMPGGFVA